MNNKKNWKKNSTAFAAPSTTGTKRKLQEVIDLTMSDSEEEGYVGDSASTTSWSPTESPMENWKNKKASWKKSMEEESSPEPSQDSTLSDPLPTLVEEEYLQDRLPPNLLAPGNLRLPYWMEVHRRLIDIGCTLLTDPTNIVRATNMGHDLVMACGQLYALPLPLSYMRFANSNVLGLPANYTSKDMSNSLGLSDSLGSGRYSLVSTLSLVEERAVRHVSIARSPRVVCQAPGSMEHGPVPAVNMENEATPVPANNLETPPSKPSNQLFSPTKAPSKLRRSISHFGLDITEPSKDSKA